MNDDIKIALITQAGPMLSGFAGLIFVCWRILRHIRSMNRKEAREEAERLGIPWDHHEITGSHRIKVAPPTEEKDNGTD